MWQCKEHGTFGDWGWNCSICGFPQGFKNFEIEEGKIRINSTKHYYQEIDIQTGKEINNFD